MTDDTETIRRQMLPEMPDHLLAAVERGERVWTTDELRDEYEVLGVHAPFVVVRRRADGVLGSLTFTHQPRWYFGWQAD